MTQAFSAKDGAALAGGLDIYHATGRCFALAGRDTLYPAIALSDRGGPFRSGRLVPADRLFRFDAPGHAPMLLARVGYHPDEGPLSDPDFQQTVERLSGRTPLTGWDKLWQHAQRALTCYAQITLILRQRPDGPGLSVIFPASAAPPRAHPNTIWI